METNEVAMTRANVATDFIMVLGVVEEVAAAALLDVVLVVERRMVGSRNE